MYYLICYNRIMASESDSKIVIQELREQISKETSFEIPGLVNQLRCNNYLIPLFEAVVNAIQSIYISNIKNGHIEIYIDRLGGQKSLSDENIPYKVQPINNIFISDNGEGFNNKNLKSFLKAFTTEKIEFGCKGVGRFTWLKVFREARIESIFIENNEKLTRQFSYKLPDGLQENTYQEHTTTKHTNNQTIIKLIDMHKTYLDGSAQRIETIAKRLLEHCFYYISLKDAPTIIISGYDNIDRDKQTKTICLNELFKEIYGNNITKQKITIKGNKFDLMHVKAFDNSEESTHKVYFCANNRTVNEESIKSITKIANLSEKIPELNGDKKFFYVAYLSGKYFDNSTDLERTSINILNNASFDDPNYLSFSEIKRDLSTYLKKFIAPYMSSLDKTKMQRIETFIKEEIPQYNYLLKETPSFFEDISPTTSDEELKKIIRTKHFQKRDEITSNFDKRLKETNKQEIIKYKDYKKNFDKLNKEVIEASQADLAEYVSHRKIVLDLFESYLHWNIEKNKYFPEKVIHDLVYPMGFTSENTPYEKHNLWLIDDRLAFSQFISSDKPINTINPESKSKKEFDLYFFDSKNLFTLDDKDNYFESISIIEFKRPERNNYSKSKKKNENPIEQILDYIKDIKEGKIKKIGERTIRTQENARYYGYVICDITDKIQEFADKAGLHKSSDGMGGYFGYNHTYKCYIEVISFEKLLADSKKRNHILFKKLGLEN